MNYIRKATKKDLSRIAEILVFSKRLNYRSIFHNDDFSFNELQVDRVMEEYKDKLDTIWVYDDGIVKGLIQIKSEEVETLYVDSFFTSQGIGTKLMNFAIETYNVKYLWVLEKNLGAQRFYKRFGFQYGDKKLNEPETTEYLIEMRR